MSQAIYPGASVNPIRAVLAAATVLIVSTGAAFALQTGSPPERRVETSVTTVTLGPVHSDLVVVPSCADTPTVDLDPSLLATGPEVSTVQTLLQIPQDGIYGPATAAAVSAVYCPDLGLYAALQALSEATPALRNAAQARQAQTAVQTVSQPVMQVAADPSLEPCGGAYPPCWVAQRESGGNYNAYNATGCASNGRSGCYGKWQFGWFWGGKLGLPDDLSTATPAQQDEAALELWNGGAGCSNWAAC